MIKKFIKGWGVWILIIFFGFTYSFWSVTRHNRFQTDAVDLAIFDQPLWRYSRLEEPLSTIKFNTYPGEHILGDHFHPLIIPLAGLFWLWDDVRILLIAQALLAVLSVFPIYLLAKKRLGTLFALALSFSFLAFIGFQTAIDYDFHEVTAGVGIISLAVYFMMENRFRPFLITMFLGFLLKEDVPLIFAGLGLFFMFPLKRFRQGLFIVLTCLVYYLVLTSYIIPYFKHDRFAYEELDPRIGKTTTDLFKKVITDPGLVLEVFFLPAVKFKTMLNLIGSFVFLPLLSPLTLVAVLPNFLSRFLTGLGQRWLIRYQYNIILTPLFAWGAVLGLENLIRLLTRLGWKGVKARLITTASALLVIITVIQTVRTNSPFMRILNPVSYYYEPRFEINQKLISMIPKDPSISVVAQSTFVPHLSHRYAIFRFEDWVVEKIKPDFVLMSADEGSDPPWGREVKLEKIASLSKRKNYEILYYDGVRLLMKKKTI